MSQVARSGIGVGLGRVDVAGCLKQVCMAAARAGGCSPHHAERGHTLEVLAWPRHAHVHG